MNGRTPGRPQKPSGSYGENVGSPAGGVGGLLSEAIRAGTDVLEGSLTVLAQVWMTTVIVPSAKPSLKVSAAAGPYPVSHPDRGEQWRSKCPTRLLIPRSSVT